MYILLESGPALGRLADVSSHETALNVSVSFLAGLQRGFFLFKTCVLYVIGAFVF